MDIFVERLNKILDNSGISKYRLAKDIGASRQTVIKWCKGLTKPNATCIIKIVKYFGVSANYLLGLD